MLQRFSPLLIALALVSASVAGPARACRLALALGFDVSHSVDEADYGIGGATALGGSLALRDGLPAVAIRHNRC